MESTKILDEVKAWLGDRVGEDSTEKDILKDLQEGGCVSGMVPKLIYTGDTNDFFDRHKEEIFELIENYCCEYGCDLREFLVGENHFPLGKKDLENEIFIFGIDGFLEKNEDVADLIKNWFAWFAFEEVAYQYYSEKYEQ